MTAVILRSDARRIPLSDDTVDLVVTSPPYFALRSYQDGGEHYEGQIGSETTPQQFVDALLDVTRECIRVLKPSGSLWVNLGDKYASYEGNRQNSQSGLINASLDLPRHPTGKGLTGGGAVRQKSLMGIPWRYALACMDDLDLILRAEVVWSKPNGLPESVTDRVRRAHEQWFHFTLNPRYFAAVDHIREPHKPNQSPSALSFAREGRGTAPGQSMAPHRLGRADQGLNPLGKLPGSVWTVPTEPLRVPEHLGVDHFAAFPTEFPRRIIQGWAPEDGIVLDPFGGTGTTALAASVLGRTGISIDMSSDYCRLASWRTTDPTQRSRAARVEPVPIDRQQAEVLF